MREYEVVITSNAVVKHTYRVEAISKGHALEKVKAGMVEAESEEVYGEEETDCEVEAVKTPDPKPKAMARTRKPADPLNPCKECGAEAKYTTPEQSGDDEGFHFVGCSAECGKDSVWAMSKRSVINLWNDNNPSKARS